MHWFEIIDKILQDSAVVSKNVYNMNETEVMLSMLDFVKVLVDKNDLRGYKGAHVKRTVVIAVQCISANNKYLNSMIV